MSEYDDLVKQLLSGAEDPMWATHCEISKKTAIRAADAIQSLQARVAELEKDAEQKRNEALEEAAKVCDEESSKRDHRANNPLPGDENLPDQNCAMVQAHKGLTASMLANAIRAMKRDV